MAEKTFLERQQELSKTGFWQETHVSLTYRAVEAVHTRDILREWMIVDIVPTGSKALLKWHKRAIPLTDKELKEQYGK